MLPTCLDSTLARTTRPTTLPVRPAGAQSATVVCKSRRDSSLQRFSARNVAPSCLFLHSSSSAASSAAQHCLLTLPSVRSAEDPGSKHTSRETQETQLELQLCGRKCRTLIDFDDFTTEAFEAQTTEARTVNQLSSTQKARFLWDFRNFPSAGHQSLHWIHHTGTLCFLQ